MIAFERLRALQFIPAGLFEAVYSGNNRFWSVSSAPGADEDFPLCAAGICCSLVPNFVHLQWLARTHTVNRLGSLSSYRWASPLLATATSFLSPTSAAAWRSAASPSASSSTACPSPFYSTSFPTTTPSWRSRSIGFPTLSESSSSSSGSNANSKTATILNRTTQTTTSITGLIPGPMGGRPCTRSTTKDEGRQLLWPR